MIARLANRELQKHKVRMFHLLIEYTDYTDKCQMISLVIWLKESVTLSWAGEATEPTISPAALFYSETQKILSFLLLSVPALQRLAVFPWSLAVFPCSSGGSEWHVTTAARDVNEMTRTAEASWLAAVVRCHSGLPEVHGGTAGERGRPPAAAVLEQK